MSRVRVVAYEGIGGLETRWRGQYNSRVQMTRRARLMLREYERARDRVGLGRGGFCTAQDRSARLRPCQYLTISLFSDAQKLRDRKNVIITLPRRTSGHDSKAHKRLKAISAGNLSLTRLTDSESDSGPHASTFHAFHLRKGTANVQQTTDTDLAGKILPRLPPNRADQPWKEPLSPPRRWLVSPAVCDMAQQQN